MPKNLSITCDNCDNDITSTDAMPKFRLRLSTEKLPHRGNGGYAVAVYPPLDNDKYFCGIKCLSLWLANNGVNAD